MPTKKRATKKAAPKRRRSSTSSTRSSGTLESDARAVGFRKKKPKTPKAKTVRAMEAYLEKLTKWKKDVAHAASVYRKVQTAKK